MNEDRLALAHLEDLARRAGQTGLAHSKFLSAAEGAKARAAFAGRRDVFFLLEGGFPDAERCIGVFLQPEWGAWEPQELLGAIRLSFREEDRPGHRDILGAALGLGLERAALGDIMVCAGEAWLVCLKPLEGFILENLCRAGRAGLKAAPASLSDLPRAQQPMTQRAATVASLRLDAVLAAMFCLSRQNAADKIRAGQVQLAHRECTAPAAQVNVGDVVTLRGTGRARLLEVGGESRKGRLHIRYGIYG